MLTTVAHDCLQVQRRQRRLLLGLLLVALPTLGQVPAGTATFVKTDVSTAGTWRGVYGADGFNVIGNSASVPAYVTVTPSGNSSYVWASSTSDTRAVQKVSNPADRIAACWYSSGSFTIDLAFKDTNTHPVAVYVVDWDNYNGRAEKVDVIDANNNLLDSRSVASFVPGEYLVWNLSGHVILRVTNTNPSSNAVVSGLFFGAGGSVPPPLPATGAATFVRTDISTAGTWKGVYGADGFNVIGNSASVPAYVTVTPSGNNSYVWASSTSDTRALQKASVPADRIAACWYSSTSFSIDLAFKDSNTHPVAVYLVDWDNSNGRAEKVDVIDANNNLLDTRSVSSFTGGQYLVWNLSGHVILRITNAKAPNAVVSGLFFGTLPPTVSVSMSPSSVNLLAGGSQQFSAAVLGSANTNVTLSLSPVIGTISAAGLYAAPATLSSQQIVTVKATSVADPTKSATAAVTLNPPVNVTVSPGSVSLTQSQTQSFAATVTGTSNTAVTWSVSPVVGSVSASGLYTAPALIVSSQTVTVKATSVADSTKSATAAVTLNPPVNVTVSPSSVTLTQSQTQSFPATVTGTSNTAVTWSISPAVGSISAAGLYTAPGSITSSQTVTVKATSVADSSKSAAATVTLNPPVNVTVSPSSVTLTQSQTQSFAATVTGTSNTAVAWSISPALGSISASGLYTAPASISGSQTVTVKATSAADSTKSASGTVTLNPPVSVTVAPASVTLTQSQTQSFSATVTGTSNTVVTWSLSPVVGSISAAGLYTAPASIASSQTVTVTATSVADFTKSAAATVALNPPVGVTVSPSSVTLTQSQTQSFAATVTGTSNTAVTWSLSPVVGSISAAGLYTAPASITSSQTVTVMATSAADSTKSASATVTLNPPVNVTVSPGSVTLTQSQTQTFSATVTGTSNIAVTWSLSPAVGSMSAAGLYTAPASISSSQTVTVKATSVADATKSSTVTVTLNPPVGVTVGPGSVILTQSQTQSFAAAVTGTSNIAVTWSISPVVGSISASGLYTAPASITSSQTVTVTATSVADSTKSATAAVTLNPPVNVTVSPSSVTLTQSQTQSFAATVTGTSNTAVTWSLSPAVGSISAAGLYTAPVSIVSSQTVTVKATSVADSTKSASATVTLNPPVNVTVSPSSVTLTQSQTQSFAATVTGTSNTAVTWSLSPAVGSISAAGLYTAPASISGSQTVTVTATSVADSTKSASATVTLNPPVGVTVNPGSVTLTQSQTQSFAATVTGTSNTAVTWSISPALGSISAAGLYTAPASIVSSQTVAVKATSVADSTKSATAAVTLNPPVSVTVSPASVTLTQSQTQSFAAAVTNTGNTAVTWSISPVVGSISASGLYTAPASITSSQTVAVKATSVADSTKSATAIVTLNPSVTVSLTPSSASLQPSQSLTVTTMVSGTSNTAVTWSFSPTLGSLASSATTAVYVAPSTAPTTQTVTITAASMADASKTATAVITLLQAVAVSLSPSAVSLAPSSTQPFTATVLGTSNTAVTWSINPSVGTISSAGLYTAPSSIVTSQTVTVMAQSVADPTKSASATISLVPLTGTFTYYVDSFNGSDSNPGTLAKPWKTIAKVNGLPCGSSAGQLGPGMSIGFRAGGTWREQLTVPCSGAAGNPVTFGAYGTDGTPIITGADLFTAWASSTTTISAWTTIAPAFNHNDSGYTYKITRAGTTLTSGSVTSSNMRLSLINGVAFVDFGVSGALTPYLGDELTITDSTGSHSIVGYIAAAGTGETYGRQLLPDPALETVADFGYTPNATISILNSGCQADNCLQLSLAAAYGNTRMQFGPVTTGMLLRASAYLKKGTETGWCMQSIADSNYSAITPLPYKTCPSSWTQEISYGTADTTSANGYYQQYQGDTSGLTSLFDTASVTQVLTPSSTGVTVSSGSPVTVYHAYYSTAPNQVIEDSKSLVQNTVGGTALSVGQWYLDTVNNYIWVRLTGDDDPSGHTVEASQRDNAMLISGNNYITATGITFAGANSRYGSVAISPGSYITIKNCTVTNSYGYGVWSWNASTPSAYVMIDGCTISYSGAGGVEMNDYTQHWTIQNSVIHDNCLNAALNLYDAGIKVTGPTTTFSNVIQNNDVYSNGTGVDQGAGIWIDTGPENNIIRWNKVHGNAFHNIFVEVSPNNQVYGNVAYGSSSDGIVVSGHSGSPMSGTVVYNNTIYGNAGAGLVASSEDKSAGVFINNTFSNNLSTGNGGSQFEAYNGGENDGTMGYGNIYTHNGFGPTGTNFIEWGGSVYKSTYAAWEAASGNCGTTGCSHSLDADPEMVSPSTSDFTLQPGSPAVGAGVYIPEVSSANPPNIGAK